MWNFVYLVGRVALAAMFVWSGAGKLVDPAGITAMLSGRGLPVPVVLAYAAGLAELLAGLMVVVGFQTRLAALALIAFTVAATYLGHPFWTMEGGARRANLIHAWKNLSVIGGLLMLMAAGPGRFSVDRR
jgi:putative oxidoreductase